MRLPLEDSRNRQLAWGCALLSGLPIVATNGKRPRDLLVERINRLEKQGAETNKRLDETNKRLDETNSRLDQVVAILGGIARTWLGKAENWSGTASFFRLSPSVWIALPMR